MGRRRAAGGARVLSGSPPAFGTGPSSEARRAEDARRNELDLATIRALRAGELDPDAAWRDLIGRHQRSLFSIAYRFTGNYSDADELAHEIVIRLYRQLDRFDPRAHFAVWVNSVARNYCIDRYRVRVRERQWLLPEPPLDRLRSRGGRDPHQQVELRETREEVTAALKLLSPKLREAIRLRFLLELPYDEICERLGIPAGTVKSRIHRGRAEMRRRLAEIREAAAPGQRAAPTGERTTMRSRS